ncbi:DUF4294 domain-containing protein [Flavobacterium orientale]|uniref:DUF4294 domain-containing protein n=1 Tax=Flavobacterium orientale TaxID=1756020 RepID=A0A916Y9N8_9FLAO|nr:DUF4294 domain-containing protein [Flavobacterium orientale]GGD36322.1 hypothetical protein GCM10011343_27710 [Flavobacterium orientale]
MKSYVFTFLFLFLGYSGFAQETKKDSTVIYYLIGNDSILRSSLELDEVVVTGKSKSKSDEDRKKFLLLQRRVLKVYPYAKSGADNLTMLNNNMAKLKTEKEKKKYFKIVEKYMEKEFEAQLKKLSRKEGQILVKLIHRQTGKSTFTLIKDLKSGWKAFWSNNTAKLFDIDLKTEFQPFDVTEDFLIESILVKAFNEGRLQRQPAAIAIDYPELSKTWKDKVEQSKKE